MKGQTKTHSWLETFTNLAIGMAINVVAQFTFFPLLGVHADVSQQFEIVAIFTVISVIRQYLLRRLYNRLMLWQQEH